MKMKKWFFYFDHVRREQQHSIECPNQYQHLKEKRRMIGSRKKQIIMRVLDRCSFISAGLDWISTLSVWAKLKRKKENIKLKRKG